VKTIGLLGGMSWESTVPYYRIVNETVKARLGGLHSARLVLYSVDFHEVERFMPEGNWEEIGHRLADAGRALRAAGADFIVLCTNTMHRVAPAIEAAAGIPLLHIVDVTGEETRRLGFAKVGLLGTRFTMEQDFFRERLRERAGVEVVVPGEADRAIVHAVIFEELCRGLVREESRREYGRIMARLAQDGAQAVVFGCTEIAMLVGPRDCPVPVIDTTALHARRAAERALE
jgi:aspartate racemase